MVLSSLRLLECDTLSLPANIITALELTMIGIPVPPRSGITESIDPPETPAVGPSGFGTGRSPTGVFGSARGSESVGLMPRPGLERRKQCPGYSGVVVQFEGPVARIKLRLEVRTLYSSFSPFLGVLDLRHLSTAIRAKFESHRVGTTGFRVNC